MVKLVMGFSFLEHSFSTPMLGCWEQSIVVLVVFRCCFGYQKIDSNVGIVDNGLYRLFMSFGGGLPTVLSFVLVVS